MTVPFRRDCGIRRCRKTAWVATILLAAVAAAPARTGPGASEQEPLDLELEEHVDIDLILIDFTVLDRDDSTVGDLTLDDFAVTVMGRSVEVVSLDVNCPQGGLPDPRVRDLAPPPALSVPTAPEQKIVLAFDYHHMVWATEAIDYALRALDRWSSGNEEHMVVALAEAITVVTPFTRDIEQVRRGLERMRTDPRLYAGNYDSLTQFAFYERIESLFDLLERVDGNKKVVLFSGPFPGDDFYHDVQYRELAGLSARVRAQVYPVSTTGMTTEFTLEGGVSGPFALRRLANETGGRMTANTNDLGLAYARARRDAGCMYTIGFYDHHVRYDRERRYKIEVGRPGLRAVHSLYYVVRSREEQRKSQVRTAGMAPGAFLDPGVQVKLDLVRPLERYWETRISARIRLTADQLFPDDRPWELNGWVRRSWGTRVKRFKQPVALPTFKPDLGDVPAVQVEEGLRLRPGRYTVNLALSHPLSSSPLSAVLEVDVPPVEPAIDEPPAAAQE